MIGVWRPIPASAALMAAVASSPVHLGHLDIHQHEVERLSLPHRDRLPAVVGDRCHVAQLGKHEEDDTLIMRIVFSHQDTQRPR